MELPGDEGTSRPELRLLTEPPRTPEPPVSAIVGVGVHLVRPADLLADTMLLSPALNRLVLHVSDAFLARWKVLSETVDFPTRKSIVDVAAALSRQPRHPALTPEPTGDAGVVMANVNSRWHLLFVDEPGRVVLLDVKETVAH